MLTGMPARLRSFVRKCAAALGAGLQQDCEAFPGQEVRWA